MFGYVYEVHCFNFDLYLNLYLMSHHQTAKAAAQADWERRIAMALEVVSTPTTKEPK